MAELLGETPESALAVYAHPDDADVACGGTLARWAADGCQVHLVVCTDGGKGTSDPGLSPAQLVKVRSEEAATAAALVGVASHQNLGAGDGELDEGTAFRATLVELVRRIRPQVVLGHDPTAVFFGEEYFNHRDHRVAGWALLDAVAPAAALPLYFPERGPAHQVSEVYLSGTLEPNVFVDISSAIETKVKAVECHRSQFAASEGWVGEAVRRRARDEGRRARVAFAEGFRRLRIGP